MRESAMAGRGRCKRANSSSSILVGLPIIHEIEKQRNISTDMLFRNTERPVQRIS